MNNLDITNKAIGTFTVYNFLNSISKPFTSLPAYAKGLIDNQGYFKLNADQMITADISTFELFIIYLKRLFNQIANPSTRSLLTSTSGAMTLFKEELEQYDIDSDYVIESIIQHLNEQEGPTNAVGPGNIAGIPQGGKIIADDGYMDLVITGRKNLKRKKNPLEKIKGPQAPVGLESSY